MQKGLKSSRAPKKAIMKFIEKFNGLAETNKPLAELNTFGTGGPAQLYSRIHSTEELSAVVKAASELEIPFFMLGGGSNLLISDEGYDGLIIHNCIMGMELSGENLTCGAGEKLQTLVDFAAENSLSGLEFASGIWGTVGGAVFGNAGAYGAEIGNTVSSVELVDRLGNIRIEMAPYFEFNYRYSKLKKTREFVTKATFALKMGDKEKIRCKIEEIMAARMSKLPSIEHSAGCFFKNIPDDSQPYGKLPAGKLLDEIGAKDISYGGARVYGNHANIIINNGSAHSKDIYHLAEILKKKVKAKFGVDLSEEITYLGKF